MSLKPIESHIGEERSFAPPAEFVKNAHIGPDAYEQLLALGLEDPQSYWEGAAEELYWQQKWTQVLQWDLPHAKWFVGGKLNATENCLDRHVAQKDRANKAALVWEGEPGDVRTLTYQQLYDDVCTFSGALLARGVEPGDRVAIYMPLVPEAAVAMLACARIGATHSVVFGGFSAESLRDRINDSTCKAVITADGGYRKGGVIALKDVVDESLKDDQCPSVETVFVLQRTGHGCKMHDGRDVWWHDAVAQEDLEPVWTAPALDAEHPLFILYTSGTTGKPKGVVHSTGGYMTQVQRTTRLVFDMKDDDVYWCSADVGWITGHSYVVYGPLALGATVFMYEGGPTTPGPDRFWDLIEKHRVSIFYTAPTAIRAFMRLGDEHVQKHDLSSLRLLGTVGEPINPEAWMWYRNVIGDERCPIVDTWWQTETGGMMISPLPGAVDTKPGSATKPLPGIVLDVVKQEGDTWVSCDANEGGLLVAKHPWPSMMRTVWGDDERFRQTYWVQVPGCYFTGDGARKDEDGYFWIMGRVDDVVNVSGHRLGTMEVESALVAHEKVTEAAVVARPDEVTGQAIVAFVTVHQNVEVSPALVDELKQSVAGHIGSFARPADIRFAAALPKTRSGKIMRRLLRQLATEGKVTQDMTSLEDLSVIAALSQATGEE